jgi:hypothetical protein
VINHLSSTMNYTTYPNTDEVASATWADPLWALGYQDDPSLPVPQSTYPDVISAGYLSTAGSYVPNFNAVDEAAFSTTPTTEMGEIALPIQADFTNQVSSKMFWNANMDLPCRFTERF